jgi:predicted nucleic acid-binding protein
VRLVLDASAAVRLIMRMDDALLLADQLDGASLVLVPGLFRTEVANALWKYVRAEQLSADNALRRLDEALALSDAEIPDSELLTEALDSACKTGHPVYDQLYVILARRHAARLLTRDRRLAELAGQLGVGLVS